MTEIKYDVGAFQKHAQMVRDARDEFLKIEDAQRNELGPILDIISTGMHALVKEVYEYGQFLPLEEEEDFSIVEEGLARTAYSFFNLRNGVYKDLECIYGIIANEELSSDLHIPRPDTVMSLLSAVKRIINLEDGERDKAIELGDKVFRGIYHASKSIYDPETDPQSVIAPGSDSEYITHREKVLPALADSFKS
ncbi:MAG: hypothetical protein KAJ88_02345 [Candidatus Aenigmarchaeota archaeon]|nr:hypothetical protein [Candidatus Aenigmarchaeota archaeon]